MRSVEAAGILAAVLSGWLLAAASAPAATVYRCRGTDGHVAYQDRPCADVRRQTRIEPPPAASPDYGVTAAARPKAPPRGSRATGRARLREQPSSYECRAANGEVFYRHSACPKSIPAANGGGRRRGGETAAAAVTAVPLTRAEACRRLAAAGSIGRSGRDRDERVSTYERNAGRDPCR
jgi:hypothetical protein